MTFLPPQPLSPLDGRYRSAVLPLGDFLSEAGLNRARVHVEVEWLAYLTSHSLLGATPLPVAAMPTPRDQLVKNGTLPPPPPGRVDDVRLLQTGTIQK